MKKFIIKTVLILAAIRCIAATDAGQKSQDGALSRNLTTFNAIVKELQNNYVDSIAPDRAFNAAISALLETVDPYTEYYPDDDRQTIQTMTTGEFGGIGSYLMDRDSSTYISAPMKDSPAARAGIRAGDRILRVDSFDVSRKSSSEVTKVLRGKPNTAVTLRLQRSFTEDSIIDVTLTRELIQQPSVPLYTVVDNTGYIQLTSFIKKSPAEVKAALESFKNNPQVKNIVLDLRGNGGGLVESAVDILSYFLPKGTEVVRTRGKDSTSERIYKTTRTPIYPDIPLAVLIDGGTASASEIVAGAIQDLDRGVLIGSRSFGKGLVQSTRPLPFNGLLKITVAKYYTPSGRLIQALDYGHRNEDGSVSRIPDSLTNEFKTRNGRIIRDGGGLTPDSTIDWGKINRLVYNVVRDNWSFDFATHYAATHPTIAPASEFVITDSIYDEFKKSIDPTKFKYDRVMEDAIKALREIATEEGYMADDTKEAFDRLQGLLVHDLQRDLDTHRPEIEEYLGSEIVSRYYYEPGKSEYALRTDKALKAAMEILGSDRYSKLLKPSKTTFNKK